MRTWHFFEILPLIYFAPLFIILSNRSFWNHLKNDFNLRIFQFIHFNEIFCPFHYMIRCHFTLNPFLYPRKYNLLCRKDINIHIDFQSSPFRRFPFFFFFFGKLQFISETIFADQIPINHWLSISKIRLTTKSEHSSSPLAFDPLESESFRTEHTTLFKKKKTRLQNVTFSLIYVWLLV